MSGLKGLNVTFLTTKPSYLSGNIGILPDILNTVYMLVVSIAVLLPLGVGAAVYLSEYAKNHTLVRFIDSSAEILSGIPSIIYGLVGMLFFCQFLNMHTSLLACSLTLVVMNLPTIMRTTRESLLTVPKGLKSGCVWTGASSGEFVRNDCHSGNVWDGNSDADVCPVLQGRMLENRAASFSQPGLHIHFTVFCGITSSGATPPLRCMCMPEQGESRSHFPIAVILLALAVINQSLCRLVNKYYKKKGKDSMGKFELKT